MKERGGCRTGSETFGQIWRASQTTFVIALTLIFLFPASNAVTEETFLQNIGRLAEQGDREAQFSLALAYEQGGLGLPRDPVAATGWFLKAAHQELAGACLYLGIKYESATGVDLDLVQAGHWYEKAALHDRPMAQYLLGRLYSSPENPHSDPVKAYAWLTLAAQWQYSDAENSRQLIAEQLTPKQHGEAAEMLDSLRERMTAMRETKNNLRRAP